MFQYLNAKNNFENSRMIDLNDISNLIDQNLEKIENNISISQSQKVKTIAENGGETMSSLVNHVIGLETHVEAMQHHNLSMDLNNGYGKTIGWGYVLSASLKLICPFKKSCSFQ